MPCTMGSMRSNQLASRAKKPEIETAQDRRGLTTKQERAYKKQVAQLYGRGVSRQRISITYYAKLHPESVGSSYDDRVRLCNRRLKGWEREQAFRDLVWEEAVARLDMESPDILDGIAGKAKDGRVDAAKLALAVTGRHQPIEQAGSATNVQVVFATNIPRPAVTAPFIPMSHEVKAIARRAEAIRKSDVDTDEDG